MKKRWLICKINVTLIVCTYALLLGYQLTFVSKTVQAVEVNSVNVRLPSFPVQINGVVIDPYKANYPPIVYKDITYFPLTWDYTRTLGIAYTWSESEGLRIDTYGLRNQLRPAPDTNGDNKNKTYVAELVSYPVLINGKLIENGSEEYPLLSFRNITYFPMTWRFMHDEFQMVLSWDDQTGFTVISPQRHYFYSVINDDEDFLYINSGIQGVKIRKSLEETPTLLTDEEINKLSSLPTRPDDTVLPEADFKSLESPIIERKEKAFYYKGRELFSFSPIPKDGSSSPVGFMEGNPLSKLYTESWFDLDTGRNILSLAEVDSTPLPLAPDINNHYRYFFVSGNGSPLPINGFTNWPISGVLQNPNGSWWLTSRPFLGDSISARNMHITGELSLLQPNGESILVNQLLKVREIEVLSREGDGSLIFRAYSRTLEKDNPGFGVYEINTTGEFTKLSDLYGPAYVASDGDLWVMDRYLNRVTNLTKKVSRLWYDYEFPFTS